MSQSFDPRQGFDQNGQMIPKAYDALLLASFGGPEGQDDVLPFLRNVTGGRGIPDERLEEVAVHYRKNGGVSPINEQNRELKAALEAELASRGINLPVYWGNRNWHPFVNDTLQQLADDGHRKVLMLGTGAYSGYSACRQYREDLGMGLLATGLDGVVEVDKIRQFFDTPAFVEPFVQSLRISLAKVQAQLAEAGKTDKPVKIVFVTHSIPMGDAQAAGPKEIREANSENLYTAQHRAVAQYILSQVEEAKGLDYSLVYQSRSGAPHMPWLEPDINDALEEDAAAGVGGVVVVPIGFISDHMEVLWDLDTEAKDTCAQLGLAFDRVATPGTQQPFVSGLVDLIEERLLGEDGKARRAGRASVVQGGPWFDVCRPGCCEKRALDGTLRPTIAAVDSEVGVPQS
ncbi:ferrochelatase [Glutamicibacter sp. M10]|uniref:ferrochelatase n=1 Tax=Glutamicibacter sp. M10 TaxID=3023076 RepID=UPI0021C7FF98|nr:ferrochelatase [Glutamicibacter sp. M10]UXN30596.1 ferrochelatase [Glutamicibacter sp. M10]